MLNIIALATVFILVIYFNDRIRSEIWAFVLAFRRVLCPFFYFLCFCLLYAFANSGTLGLWTIWKASENNYPKSSSNTH